MLGFEEVEKYDPELAQAMSDELTRQRTHIELIASENLVSKAVMAAMGSVLTNKYAKMAKNIRFRTSRRIISILCQ